MLKIACNYGGFLRRWSPRVGVFCFEEWSYELRYAMERALTGEKHFAGVAGCGADAPVLGANEFAGKDGTRAFVKITARLGNQLGKTVSAHEATTFSGTSYIQYLYSNFGELEIAVSQIADQGVDRGSRDIGTMARDYNGPRFLHRSGRQGHRVDIRKRGVLASYCHWCSTNNSSSMVIAHVIKA